QLLGPQPVEGVPPLLQDPLGPPVGRLAQVPVAGARRRHLDPVRKTPLRYPRPEHRLRHRRPADVSETDEQDPHFAHRDTSSKVVEAWHLPPMVPEAGAGGQAEARAGAPTRVRSGIECTGSEHPGERTGTDA